MSKILAFYSIPESTVRVETNREPRLMSLDDLLWCFGGRFQLVDADTKTPIFSLDDVCLLGLATDLANTINELEKFDENNFRDRDGSYSLMFTRDGRDVTVTEEFSGQVVTVSYDDLASAVGDYLVSIRLDFERYFPELVHNATFVELMQKNQRALLRKV